MSADAKEFDDAIAAARDDDERAPRDELDDEEEELTEEQKDAIAVRCLRIFNILLMLMGGALTGLALWASTFAIAGVGTTVAYAVAAVGGAIFMLTVLGLVGAVGRFFTLLLVYYTALIFTSLGLLVLGGFCFVLTESAVAYTRDNWEVLIATLPPAQRAAASLDYVSGGLRFIMWGIGGFCLLMLGLVLAALSSVTRLVTPIRAFTLLLQASNVTLLPIGVALMGVATYVADTAVGPEAPIMSFAMFVMGVFVITLIMVGCCGTTLRSRGIIRLFMLVTAVLAALFLAFGVASWASAVKVAAFVVSEWASLRRLLPSGFAGKYDQTQFRNFMDTNLRAMGFLAVFTGVVLGVQAYGARRLRAEIRAAAELEAEAFEAAASGVISVDDAQALSRATTPGWAELAWKRVWTKGTRRSRCCVVCGFGTLVFLVFAVVGIATAVLYFTTHCTKLGTFAENNDYSGAPMGPYVFVHNNYTRGTTRVVVETSSAVTTPATTLAFRKGAYKAGMADPGWPDVTTRTGVPALDVLGAGAGVPVTARGLTTLQAPPTEYLGVDASCQSADVTVSLPRAGLVGGNTREAGDAAPLALELITGSAYAGVEMDWDGVAKADRPRVRRLDVYASDGPVDLMGVLVGSKGASVATAQGEISVARMDAQCDAGDLGGATGGVALSTVRGGVEIDASTFLDCDVRVTGQAALARVTWTKVTNTLGGGRLALTSGSGSVEVTSSSVDILELRGDDGSVRVDNATVSVSLKASTGTGPVSLQRLRIGARGGIQVETDTGGISVYATQFAGILSVVTGGSVSCTGTGFDDANPCSQAGVSETGADGGRLSVVEAVRVNCAARGDCPYLGGVTITSSLGSVVIRMDRWTR